MPDTTSLNVEPAAPAAPVAPTPVADIVDSTLVGSERMVPLSALIEERRGRQTASQERDRLAAETETLRQKASNFDTVEPYLPLLATHPKVTGRPAPVAPTNLPDPELVEIADTWGFTDPNTGEPDLKRAAAVKNYITKQTDGRVSEAVKPVAAQAAQVQARALRTQAYGTVDKSNRPFAAREHIDQVLDNLPVEQQAIPEIVASALMIARGMGVQPSAEPLHTEGSGRPAQGGTPLSGWERAAARARGMDDAQWATASKANDSNLLE